jgi:hypothetical protein
MFGISLIGIALAAVDFPSTSYTLSVLAGAPGGVGNIDGTGSGARFDYTTGVAADSAGNIYVADTYNCTIRKVTSSGVVTTMAGSADRLADQCGSSDGTGSNARFANPSGVAVDGSGNIYVADTDNCAIRKITSSGGVTTVAGSAGHCGSSDGSGSAAQFYGPLGIAIDGSGNLYVADTGNNAIRKITPVGIVTTFAGSAGVSGFSDGTGSAAIFNNPQGIATDSGGNVYVADTANNSIRKITPAGVVTTLAGTEGSGTGSQDGTGTNAQFSRPCSVAVDGNGNVYVADTNNQTIRKITPVGVVTTFVGTAGQIGYADGTGSAAQFNYPQGVAVSISGNVIVSDSDNDTIRTITPAGAVTTLAGAAPMIGDTNGAGSAARFYDPTDAVVDHNGTLYVADYSNSLIRKITAAGVVSTLSDGTNDPTGIGFSGPEGLALDGSGNVYVADTLNNTIRVVSSTGMVSTLAGTAGRVGSADGTGAAASFHFPSGVAVDASGNLFVTDSLNSTIRKISPAGVVTTLAGTAGQPGISDGTGSAAQFGFPWGIAIDPSGNLYVSDRSANTIRMISPAGVVTTLAGMGGVIGSSDGTGSAARFALPQGIALDGSNNVYVADTVNQTIRKVNPGGVVSTLLGQVNRQGLVTGQGPGILNSPMGVAVASDGSRIYVPTENEIVEASASPAATPTFSPTAGTYASTQSVSIADSTSGATIYYTTDGSTPTINSTQYTGPITVSTSQTLNSIATASGYTSSSVASATYTISVGGTTTGGTTGGTSTGGTSGGTTGGTTTGGTSGGTTGGMTTGGTSGGTTGGTTTGGTSGGTTGGTTTGGTSGGTTGGTTTGGTSGGTTGGMTTGGTSGGTTGGTTTGSAQTVGSLSETSSGSGGGAGSPITLGIMTLAALARRRRGSA